jgi:hypothetical protein
MLNAAAQGGMKNSPVSWPANNAAWSLNEVTPDSGHT